MVPIQSGASYTLGYHALLWREACGGKPGFVRRPVKTPPVGRWGPALSRQVGTRLEKRQLPRPVGGTAQIPSANAAENQIQTLINFFLEQPGSDSFLSFPTLHPRTCRKFSLWFWGCVCNLVLGGDRTLPFTEPPAQVKALLTELKGTHCISWPSKAHTCPSAVFVTEDRWCDFQ